MRSLDSINGRSIQTLLRGENYSKQWDEFQDTVSIPEKISISLNRGRKESVGNDDVPIVCALKYKIVRMT